MSNFKEWYLLKECAELLQVTTKTIQRKIADIEPTKIRKDKNRIFVHHSIVESWQGIPIAPSEPSKETLQTVPPIESAKEAPTKTDSLPPNLNEVLHTLENQLKTKDSQIKSLLRRNKELNFIVAKQQNQLADKQNKLLPMPNELPIKKEAPTNVPAIVLLAVVLVLILFILLN